MQIVQPYARIIVPVRKFIQSETGESGDTFEKDDGIDILRSVEWIGRISHRSEDSQTDGSWERFIKAVVLGKGDWSITEHASVTVDAVVDRGITHEWVRHRLGAYTQESTRFVNYEKKMPPSFIVPPGLTFEQSDLWQKSIVQAEESYQALLRTSSCTPQIARSVFPNALASRIIVTYNLRMWRHFFIMRTTKEAHPQMRQVTIPLLAEFQSKIPLLYDDIIPNEPQRAAMSKPR